MDAPSRSPPATAAAAAAAAPAPAAASRPIVPEARGLEWVKAVGMPVVTLVITLIGGYYFNNLVKERESRESGERLYAQLLTQREQSDAQIRKEMLNLVVNNFFVDAKKGDLPAQVLKLELLASNFNQSLDLAPLFKELARRLGDKAEIAGTSAADMRRRLDVSAATLIIKQVTSLGRRGHAREVSVPLADWDKRFGQPFIDERLPYARLDYASDGAASRSQGTVRFRVEIIDVDIDRREVEVRLRVDLPGDTDQNLDRHFWVSPYDFPMLDNTPLPFGLRCSVVISDFFVPSADDGDREANSVVKFHLVVFPAVGASFKDRQEYEDVQFDKLRLNDRLPTPAASSVAAAVSSPSGGKP
jgi:hypothetical protein